MNYSHIYTHSRIRSGLLTFFSSLVIQESLINFAGERLRSKMDSHCESIFGFCLSASYPIRIRRLQLQNILPSLSQIGKWQWLCHRRILGAMLRLGNL